MGGMLKQNRKDALETNSAANLSNEANEHRQCNDTSTNDSKHTTNTKCIMHGGSELAHSNAILLTDQSEAYITPSS